MEKDNYEPIWYCYLNNNMYFHNTFSPIYISTILKCTKNLYHQRV